MCIRDSESRVHNRLNAGGFVPRGFTPAGSNPSSPDCAFMYGGVRNNLEVKLDLRTDYGQGTLIIVVVLGLLVVLILHQQKR